ncbi:hypothetical protein LOY37_04070 [Pseudomonas sp. B21-012]|uniref:hypothetical protein n=1 Tax=Pseudomonas sp. B21-012 TaxID=2895472 RepID=UPI002160E731|nr:hypothetical protein [Pseudomonas sp. B21-012]UVM56767.1 hypothetical protein LOY37_04070 [Pseudomonas sp. B21-012]
MNADEYRKAMDDDKGYQSKRRALVFISLLLLALVASGAQIKEANTFIFKIEFANHEGLKYLLVAAVIACMLRYYSYSEKYNNHLFSIWSGRLLNDYTVYHIDYDGPPTTSGLAGRRADIYVGDKYDTDNPIYRRNGILKRSIGFKTGGYDENHGEIYYTEYFDLNEYSDRWRRRDFFKLLLAEFKYRAQAWFKHRETLDLAFPYLLAASSLLAFAINFALHSSLDEKPIRFDEVRVEVAGTQHG